MLQLTRKADYGIRLMLEVAAHADSATTTAEVARRQRIPYQFIRKVAHMLVLQRLLVSERGVGLTLARPAQDITVLDIVRAFESPSLNRCTVDPPLCDRRESCAVYPVWAEAQQSVERVLGGSRLSDIVERQAALNREASRPRSGREASLAGPTAQGPR